MAQIQNQDPLSPQDNTEYVAQLAQFSSLEQQMNTNTTLATISTQLQGQANTQDMDLIGKTVTVSGSIVTASGSSGAIPINFTLDSASATTTVTIKNSSGDTIRSLEVGAEKAGSNTVNWDGKDSSGNIVTAGSYQISVSAKSQAGASVGVSQSTTSTVESIAYDQGYPVLTLANGVTSPVSNLVKVESSSTSTGS